MKKIRNFGIIAHIDHGKSTLADRFLELTHTVDEKKMMPQMLDSMELEREKGITIKLQPARMNYKGYEFNMIDTPGHVDFTYEVSRSMAAIEGAVLLVDVLKGIQAQTLMNLEYANKQGIRIIPVINKIDMIRRDDPLDMERLEAVKKELKLLVNEEILEISSKSGVGVEKVLDRIIEDFPAPKEEHGETKALIFDFQFDAFKGVVAYIRVMSGEIKKGDEVYLINSKTRGKVKEAGYFNPERKTQDKLITGEIGYVFLGLKDPEKVKIGDTITQHLDFENVKPLEGYKEPQPVVFISVFPEDSDNWMPLKQALGKLKLNDPAMTFRPESKSAIGRGFHCGFLGLLHAEIVIERIRREFNIDLISSAPSVSYKIINGKSEEMEINSVMDWPDPSKINKILEQYSELKIISPIEYLGGVLGMVSEYSPQTEHLSDKKILVKCLIPFREIMSDFYDRLKGITQGYGSMDYKFDSWVESDLVKLEVMVMGEVRESLSMIVPRDRAYAVAKTNLEKLKSVFPTQQFSVPLQAKVGGNIISRQTVGARRKDVTGALYGGDITRKRKLLEKQKKGKKKLAASAKIRIPQSVYWKMFKRD